MITVHTELLFVKSIYYIKVVEKIIIFFRLRATQNALVLKKLSVVIFFRKYVSVTQNGHFFPKNVGKIFGKNSKNYVLLRENAFCEKGQSGRINFFWGGFSAFMVYALTLISTAVHALQRFRVFPENTTKRERGDTLATKKKIKYSI